MIPPPIRWDDETWRRYREILFGGALILALLATGLRYLSDGFLRWVLLVLMVMVAFSWVLVLGLYAGAAINLREERQRRDRE